VEGEAELGKGAGDEDLVECGLVSSKLLHSRVVEGFCVLNSLLWARNGILVTSALIKNTILIISCHAIAIANLYNSHCSSAPAQPAIKHVNYLLITVTYVITE
jgi:hypothetical protein